MIRLLLSLISLILLLPLIVCGCLAAYVYFTYIQVQPAEYSFVHEASEIKSIEFARFVFSENGLAPTKAGIIEDTEAFITDLKSIDCHTGMSGAAFKALANGESIDGVIINYNDGSTEFITPYICVNSAFHPESITELLGVRVYGFDNAAFGQLLDKYGDGISQDDVNDFEDIIDQIPDAIPQN